ncbi:translation initiation factor IF-2 [Dorea formicigenerans]|uniref:Translation initiation factor IF-2 n=3 Tax=Dorea TaxID=189330 RepID=A0A3E4MKI2_9FIRM|nr:translation initiation factor IF-2 [Dorea formicigenerans]RGK50190.1 translation initiation factor IF-2 [Dorea formicigenerans]
MSKIKIYELAKELDKPSKELVEFLNKKDVEAKTHMSTIDEAEADMVRKAFAPKANAEKAEEEKSDAPKKKKIVQVFRPQNTQSGGRQGGKRQGQGRDDRRDNRSQTGRDDKRDNRSNGGNKNGKSQNGRKEVRDERPSQPIRPRPDRIRQQVQQMHEAEAAAAAQKKRLEQEKKEQERKENRSQGNRDNRDERRDNRGRDDRRDDRRDNRNQGGRDDRRDNRGRDDRRDNRNQGGRDDRRDNRDNRNQGGRDDRRDNHGRDDRRDDRRDNRNQGGRDDRRDDRRDNRGRDDRRDNRKNSPAIPEPIVEGQKPQRNKGKGKDDFKKKDKDFRHDEDRVGKGKKGKNEPKTQLQKPEKKEQKQEEQIKSITIPEVLTIQELADKMKIVPSVIVKKLFMQGKIVTVNQEIDYETAEEIALEFDVLCEKEEVVDVIEELLKEDEEDESKMKKRPPVVCVMGHVDHGKTSLLDAIRQTNVIDREAGGITQHIGASVVEVNGEKITFLDTPGHEAFTAMRMRGASSTDIAILVVAADDGVMPQTVEAINHAKAAGVEIIVAVNKIDKPSANVDRVKQELTEYELIAEDWGGSTIFVPVSAKTGEGLDELMEMILLTAEVMELKANPNRRARGLVLEAQLDKGRGPVATVLVQKGTLRVGDAIAAGSAHGKVRAMMDDKGRRVKEAGPSVPVEILGLDDVPNAGEVVVCCKNEKEARSFAETFIAQNKVKLLEDTKSKLSLDDLFTQIQEGNLKELDLIVKADVQGSVEAVKQSLLKLSNDEVIVKVIHGGVGAINESDVSLASASNAIIIGFNVRPDATAKETAEREGVDVRLYRVIYNAIEDVEAAMKGMLDPVFEEKVLGHAEVRQTFKASGVGTIAGSYVLDGLFERDCSVRLTRDGIVIFEGPLASLKRFKDDVKEVKAGYECGFVFANFNDIKEGDLVEAFKMVEVPR